MSEKRFMVGPLVAVLAEGRPSNIDVLDSLEAAAYCRPGPGPPHLANARLQ